MAVLDELIATSDRYRKWRDVQAKKTATPTPAMQTAEAAMQANRQKFSGSRFLRPDTSVFLESVIEGDDLMPIRYFEMGKLAAKPVGRIHIDLGPRVGQGYATGFLIAPGILLTNHHVLRTIEYANAATVTFDAEDDLNGLPRPPKVFLLDPDALFVNDETLDYCCVAVAETSTDGTSIRDFGFLRLFAGTGKIMREEFATIIQHPRGRQKQVAARNNRISVYVYDSELASDVEKAENNFIYYATDTMAGSSGAPVFSDQWFVVALHRRGVPKLSRDGKHVLRRGRGYAREDDPDTVIQYEANEGVRVSRIMRSIRSIAAKEGPMQQSAKRVAEAIDEVASRVEDGPFWVPTVGRRAASGATNGALSITSVDGLEIVRRKLNLFADAPGYDEDFLRDVRVSLPKLSTKLNAAAARRGDDPDEIILPFRHFSSVMHAARRLPIYAAVNIDGALMPTGKMPRRPTWSYDPRISDEHQPDDTIFSSMVQRGHMAAREFVYWGEDEDEMAEADRHSFTLSNVCPQIDTFNGRREWYKLERLIVAAAELPKRRISCFMGPIFGRDRLYDDLRSENSPANFDTGIRVPDRFWYIMVWAEANKARHRCFLLDQSDDIDAKEDGLEVDFDAPATVREVKLAEVEKKSGLTFSDLR
jgi:endonuclease G, mitochondrial